MIATLVASFSWLGASAASATPGPTVTISPAVAAPGQNVTISGEECYGDPYYARVTVGSVALPYAIVDDQSTGHWAATFTVPAQQPDGPLVVEADCYDFDDYYFFSYGDANLSVQAEHAPSPAPLTSTGTSPDPQSVIPIVPTGGSFALVSGGALVNSVVLPGQGVYTVDTSAGKIIFTPESGYVGSPSPATYRVTNSGGLFGESTYSPSVSALPSPSASAPPLDLGLTLDLAIGDPVTGAPSTSTAYGLLEGAAYTITVRSSPVVVGSGTVPAGGVVSRVVTLPPGLEAGWHSITFTSTFYTGAPATKTLWFVVSAQGTLLSVANSRPVLANTGDDGTAGLIVALALINVGLGLMVTRRRTSAVGLI